MKVVAGKGQHVIWFKAPHTAADSSEKETMSSHHQQSEKTCLGLVSGIVMEREGRYMFSKYLISFRMGDADTSITMHIQTLRLQITVLYG